MKKFAFRLEKYPKLPAWRSSQARCLRYSAAAKVTQASSLEKIASKMLAVLCGKKVRLLYGIDWSAVEEGPDIGGGNT